MDNSTFDFDFTLEILDALVPKNLYIDNWYEAMIKILPDYDINTKLRVAAFIAQCAHESGNFRFIKENLNYRAETLTRL